MSLAQATALFSQYSNVISAVARDGAIHAVIAHDTKLRGMPDQYEGYHVFYTHTAGDAE